jgi:predicted phage terminase large subunit-like protein
MNAPIPHIAITRAEAAAELLRRRRARSNLQDFISYVNPEYIVSAFSRTVCLELDAFLDMVERGQRPVLIFQAPPQHGKSEIVSRNLPAYVFGRWPDWNMAGLSYAADLAEDMGRDVQRVMQTDEYAVLFPLSTLNRKVTGVQPKLNSKAFEIPGAKGSYRGAGVGGPLTGRKVNIGLIDDPIKNAQEALSKVTKDGVENWYKSTFLTRLAKLSGVIIMATSWAQDDLSGRVKISNPLARVLKFPAIAEENDSLGRAPGEALIPELHPIEQLLEFKEALGAYFWAAMYQQDPRPIGGNIFTTDGVRYYRKSELPLTFDKVITSWDCTFKDTDGTDYVVGQTWGKRQAQVYLLAQVRARMSFSRTLTAVKDEHEAYPEARRILIEDKANGPAVIDTLKKTVPGIIPIEPDGSKQARAHAVTAYWEAGNVHLPHPEEAPWVVGLVEELTVFPAGAHDDQVDALTQALRDLYPGRALPLNISPIAMQSFGMQR